MTNRTKALQISNKVRHEVYERDSWEGAPVCQLCGTPYNLQLHHVIPRSLSGLGVAENLIVLCVEHHDLADHGKPDDRRDIRARIEEVMKAHYPGWREEILRYRREI